MTHWQNFYHGATAEELERYVATAHIASNPYALIACLVIEAKQNLLAETPAPVLVPTAQAE